MQSFRASSSRFVRFLRIDGVIEYPSFADVTADMVKGWVIDAMGEEEVVNLEANLDSQIESQKNPTSVTKTLES